MIFADFIPHTLAAAHGRRILLGASTRDPEEIALAHVLASEAEGGTPEERLYIAWAVRNRARKARTTIYAMEFPWRAQAGGDPPFASGKEPNAGDFALARHVLAQPLVRDPTGGATAFFEPGLQDLVARLGAIYRRHGGAPDDATPQGTRPKLWRYRRYTKGAEAIRETWTKRGERMLASVGKYELWAG